MSRRRFSTVVAVLSLVLFALTEGAARAYIDPGTGSYLTSLAVAVIFPAVIVGVVLLVIRSGRKKS